jgi:hypothetical protein
MLTDATRGLSPDLAEDLEASGPARRKPRAEALPVVA